ncbi:MAG: hypothetical protein RBU23_01025 [Candidatus Auribacterota bacterium]|jgi:hypothetical protein|nr:hypothetical protein [Candidatus Auribacterota bacterium]
MKKWTPKFKKQQKLNSFSQKRAYERGKDIDYFKLSGFEEKKKVLSE